jgi:hypothetical protein
MIKSILTIFSLCFSINAIAQIEPSEDYNCSFLKNLKFKNGVDTIMVKAVFKDAAEMVKGGSIFKTLDNEKKLKSKQFTYQIGFQPEGCLKIYYGPSNVKNPQLINAPDIIGKTVYIKCIAFEKREWEDRGIPFFVVIDVTIKKR